VTAYLARLAVRGILPDLAVRPWPGSLFATLAAGTGPGPSTGEAEAAVTAGNGWPRAGVAKPGAGRPAASAADTRAAVPASGLEAAMGPLARGPASPLPRDSAVAAAAGLVGPPAALIEPAAGAGRRERAAADEPEAWAGRPGADGSGALASVPWASTDDAEPRPARRHGTGLGRPSRPVDGAAMDAPPPATHPPARRSPAPPSGPAAPAIRPLPQPSAPPARVAVERGVRAGGDRAPAPTTVQVTIGRIEVRAAPAPPARRRRDTLATMSLEEYLRQRGGGGRR
jgi:hypothetical protein